MPSDAPDGGDRLPGGAALTAGCDAAAQAGRAEPPGGALLSIRRLLVEHVSERGRRSLVTGVDLDVVPGETVGIVGESGSGKSLTARAVVRLLPADVTASGSVWFRGRDISSVSERQLVALRGSGIAMLFQDPFTMLNPVFRAGRHIEEVLRRGEGRLARSAVRQETERRLAEVGLTEPDTERRYPFQLSGGMRQRVALAAALAGDPQLLIADEPTTALDVTTEAEILRLLREVQQRRGMGLVLITHDLRIAFSVCQRIYVLYAGRVVESAPAAELADQPLHPYSLGLMLSEPTARRRQEEFPTIEGSVPRPGEVAGQCAFAPRCRWADDACRTAAPPLALVAPGRFSACRRIGEIAVEMAAQRRAVVGHASPAGPPSTGTHALLAVQELTKTFHARSQRPVHALRGVTIEIGHDESVGLVGESGSGKSTLGRCVVGLEVPTSGQILLDGRDVSSSARLGRLDRSALRKAAQIVFQDPYSSLDPMQSVGASLREVLAVHGHAKGDIERRAAELLSLVRLPGAYASRKPSALSGGERQRVAIARALAVGPKLLVCDEPVSALDVSVQAQILRLFRQLRQELELSYLFVTHDLAVVRQIADRVYVLYRGEVVEHGTVDEVLDHPRHEYTARLIASIPRSALEGALEEEQRAGAGEREEMPLMNDRFAQEAGQCAELGSPTGDAAPR
ncbi:MAG TPA: ABC transporter ATP-binding protein [Acidimicrobiales bacterium]|nr:ABC transporter ATP-binding protein [Acidimicrobiales bacterium]